jgi:tetratricopeptide (TPR) repeat protein
MARGPSVPLEFSGHAASLKAMPEKSVSQVPRALREQYEKGLAAFQRNNFDYALQLLNAVLDQEPGFLDARQTLRATQFKKPKEKAGFFKKLVGSATSSPALAKGQIQLRSNPKEALSTAESVLNVDAGNAAAHKIVADAALQLDLPKTATLSLEIVVKADPADRKSVRALADLYFKQDQLQKAQDLYARLIEASPLDPELQQTLKNLHARRMLLEKGYGAIESGRSSYRDLLRDEAGSIALEQANRQVKDTGVVDRLILEYEAKLEAEPDNRNLIRNIADLLVQKKEFDRALEFYERILVVEGTRDPTLEKSLTDLKRRRLDHLASQLDPAAADHEEARTRLHQERDDLVLAECQARVQRFPSDLQIRFELGELLFKAGRHAEAIQEFQRSQNNPQKRIPSMNFLGQCFAVRRMNDLAVRTFQNALKEKPVLDDEKKELLYHLGCAMEKMGQAEGAMDQFKQIYEVDIGYRDVAAKVDAFYAAQG